MFKTPAQWRDARQRACLRTEGRGDALVGTPRLIDLNEIAAPPDDALKPPFPPSDHLDVETGARWGAWLVIR
jgi:hypothetical protein